MVQNKIILLVEDNSQDELLTIRALKKQGMRHEIVVCRDGAEALDWLYLKGSFAKRDESIVPAVVLLDLKLPKIDGLQVMSEIRNHASTSRLPVVILTTSKAESDIARSYDKGANSYVQKPVNYNEFSEVIKNLGIYWLLVNEAPPISGLSREELSRLSS